MKDPVSEGLFSLAVGLRPYVVSRVQCVYRDADLAEEVQTWDAQALMVFMWDRWNDLFRNELSFVERSLISELRDFRNRWAHQDYLEESDVYRVLDDIERLLKAVNSAESVVVRALRMECLNRLWMKELGDDARHRRVRLIWPYLLCGASSLAITGAVIYFISAPWSWVLSGLVFLASCELPFCRRRENLDAVLVHMSVLIVVESFTRSNALIAIHSIRNVRSAIQTVRDFDWAEVQVVSVSRRRLSPFADPQRPTAQTLSGGSLKTAVPQSIRTDRFRV